MGRPLAPIEGHDAVAVFARQLRRFWQEHFGTLTDLHTAIRGVNRTSRIGLPELSKALRGTAVPRMDILGDIVRACLRNTDRDSMRRALREWGDRHELVTAAHDHPRHSTDGGTGSETDSSLTLVNRFGTAVAVVDARWRPRVRSYADIAIAMAHIKGTTSARALARAATRNGDKLSASAVSQLCKPDRASLPGPSTVRAFLKAARQRHHVINYWLDALGVLHRQAVAREAHLSLPLAPIRLIATDLTARHGGQTTPPAEIPAA